MSFMAIKKPKKKNFNLQTWMKDLPDDLRTKAICKLTIPGSHHSLTYNINPKSPLSDDFELRERGFWGMIVSLFPKRIVAKWSKVQGINVTEQLHMGIRYFDIRVQYDADGEMIWSVHMMKAVLLSSGLAQMNNFLQTHPKEIVIVDFQHFVNFAGSEPHSKLKRLLTTTFDGRLCPREFLSMGKLSLDSMYKSGYQVIVIYRDFCNNECFFKNCYFPIVYDMAHTSASLYDSAVSHVSSPWPDKWWLILHMVLRPAGSHNFTRLFSDRTSYAKTALHQTKGFVEYLKTQAYRPTVIVGDFVHLYDAEFSKLIVSLNYSEPEGSKPTKKSKKKIRSKRTSSDDILKRMSSL